MREFLRDMVRDPSSGGKTSSSRVILLWTVVQYTAWVWVGLILDRAVPVDPYILTVLLFGPALAVAFRRAPVELAKEVLAGLVSRAGSAWSVLGRTPRPRADITDVDLVATDFGPPSTVLRDHDEV